MKTTYAYGLHLTLECLAKNNARDISTVRLHDRKGLELSSKYITSTLEYWR